MWAQVMRNAPRTASFTFDVPPEAGFVLAGSEEFLPHQYMLIFARDGDAPAEAEASPEGDAAQNQDEAGESDAGTK